MNRRFFLSAGIAAAATAAATAASANPFANVVMFDPDTREPLIARPHAAVAQANAIPREIVAYNGAEAPGTVVVDTNARRLYFVMPGGQAMRYGIGVGRPGFEWGGSQTITRKAEWPDWRPPVQMLQRRPDLPRYMPAARTTRSAPAPCIWAPRSTASTAPTSRTRSARRCPPAASA